MKIESMIYNLTGPWNSLQPLIQCNCGMLHGPETVGLTCEVCGKMAKPVYVDIEVREVDSNEVSKS